MLKTTKEIIEEKKVGESVEFKALKWAEDARKNDLDALIESFSRNGFMPEHPIMVSKKPDNLHLVLCGDRRTKALQRIKETAPITFDRILPDGNIPAIVLENLTADEETLLRSGFHD